MTTAVSKAGSLPRFSLALATGSAVMISAYIAIVWTWNMVDEVAQGHARNWQYVFPFLTAVFAAYLMRVVIRLLGSPDAADVRTAVFWLAVISVFIRFRGSGTKSEIAMWLDVKVIIAALVYIVVWPKLVKWCAVAVPDKERLRSSFNHTLIVIAIAAILLIFQLTHLK